MSKRRVTKHTRPVVTNSNDEVQIKKAEDGEKDRARDLAFILSSPRGRRWLYELIFSRSHVNRLSHVPRDTHSTAFNEGARSVGESVLETIRHEHHAAFITMLEENDITSED